MNVDVDDAFGGTHVKVLLRNVEEKLLLDQNVMRKFLEAMVDRIGMKALDDPIVYNVALKVIERFGDNEPYEDDGGITSFRTGVELDGKIALSTSHCFCHTWPLQNKGVCDVYSCKPFMIKAVLDVLKPYYKCSDRDMKLTDLSDSLVWGNEGTYCVKRVGKDSFRFW